MRSQCFRKYRLSALPYIHLKAITFQTHFPLFSSCFTCRKEAFSFVYRMKAFNKMLSNFVLSFVICFVPSQNAFMRCSSGRKANYFECFQNADVQVKSGTQWMSDGFFSRKCIQKAASLTSLIQFAQWDVFRRDKLDDASEVYLIYFVRMMKSFL